MLKHWYVYIIIAVVAELLLLVLRQIQNHKSRSLYDIFIVIFVSAFICFGAFDLIVGE